MDEHPRILEAEVSEIARPTPHEKDAEWVLDFARGEARGVSARLRADGRKANERSSDSEADLLRCSRQD